MFLASPQICAADDAPSGDTHLALGPGGYSLPSYPGARSTRNLAVPFIDAEYDGRLYSNASDLLGVYAYKSAATELGTALEYDFAERLAQDDERFRYFRDVKETTRFKLFATHTVSFITGDANVATDITGHGQGTLAQGNVWFSLPVSPKLLLSAGPGATWADARYMQTFFGVTGAQAAVSSLPVYTARPGIMDLHWNGLGTYDLSSRWSLGFAEYFAHLHGTAVDSPVTLRRRQATAFAWLAYKWK